MAEVCSRFKEAVDSIVAKKKIRILAGVDSLEEIKDPIERMDVEESIHDPYIFREMRLNYLGRIGKTLGLDLHKRPRLIDLRTLLDRTSPEAWELGVTEF